MQTGKTVAQDLPLFGADFGAYDGVAGIGRARQNFAPWSHNHGMSVCSASAGVGSALGGGDDMRQIFHRARAQQQLPMGGAGFPRERRRREDDIGRFHCPIQLRKTQVVAYGEPEFSESRLHGGNVFSARLARDDAAGFVVLAARTGEAEKMNLVVARRRASIRREQNAGGVNPFRVRVIARLGADRNGSAQNEHFVLGGDSGEEVLGGSVARIFGDGEFGVFVGGEQGEEFGQGGDIGPHFGGLGEQGFGAREVVGEVVAGLHLNASGAEGLHSAILPLLARRKEISDARKKFGGRGGNWVECANSVFQPKRTQPQFNPTQEKKESQDMNIRKILTAWLTAAALAFSAALPVGVAAAQDDKWAKIRIGVEGAYPPFSSVDEEGNLVGFDIDIARALCMEMGAECELIQQDWDGIIPALQAKKYDAIIASMSVTEERKEQVSFTGRYYKDGGKFMRRKGDKIKVSYNSLEGKSIGVQRGTVTDKFATAEFPGAEIRRYDALTNAHLDLQQGRIDLVLADQFPQQDFADKNDDVEVTGSTYTNSKYFGDIAIAVRHEDEDLREKFNAAILAIRENEVYKAINDKYFKHDIYGR